MVEREMANKKEKKKKYPISDSFITTVVFMGEVEGGPREIRPLE